MALRRSEGYKTKRITRKSRYRRNTAQGGGTSELVTVAEPVIPIAPWVSGPFLYGAGVFLHYLWLHGFWERLMFVGIFAVAGGVIGLFAVSYGRARTEFQRGHAGVTPVLFSLIVSVPLMLGFGRYSSLIMLTYWFVLSGGWVARVARSVWGDGADIHKGDPAALVGETFGLPGMQVHDQFGDPMPTPERPRSRVIRMTALRSRTEAPAPALPAGEDLDRDPDMDPSRFVDGAPDDLDVMEGVVTRKVTVRGTQGYEDILKALPGLRNAARAHSATAKPVSGNPQAALVTLVLKDFLEDVLPWPGPSQPPGSSSVEVCVGVRQSGHYQRFALAGRQGTWRGVVCGTAGSGKSRWLWLIMADCADREIVWWVCDTAKAGQTLGPVLEMIDWLVTEEEDVMGMLSALRDVISERSKLLGDRQVWTEDCGLPLLVFVCDEFANVATATKKTATMITRLSEQARSVGVSLVFLIQRPSSTNMPTDARAQLKSRFCFGLVDEQTSRMALSAQTLAAGAAPHLVDVEEDFGLHWYEGPGFPAKDWVTRCRTYGIEADVVRTRVKAGRLYRRGLDEGSTRAAGPAYAARQRTAVFGRSTDDAQAPASQTSGGSDAKTIGGHFTADNDLNPDGDTGDGVSSFSDEPRAAEVVTNPPEETRTREEVLRAVIEPLNDGTVTTAEILSRWEKITTLHRRELYRAIKACPDLSATTQKGLWILSRSRQRS